ncbi:hypothetical protein CHS0354_013748, partial [Potamilus streckersoni]
MRRFKRGFLQIMLIPVCINVEISNFQDNIKENVQFFEVSPTHVPKNQICNDSYQCEDNVIEDDVWKTTT